MTSCALRCGGLGWLLAGLVACPGSTTCPEPDAGSTGGSAGAAVIGGAVPGPVDSHCYRAGPADGGSTYQPQPVEVASCAAPGPALNPDAGLPPSPYRATEFNAAGNDDDCKYLVSWTSTPIAKGTPVTFFVAVQYATTGAPLTGLGNGDGGAGPLPSCPPDGPLRPELYVEIGGDPDGGLVNHINPEPAVAGGDYPIFETAPGSGVYQIGPAAFFDESGLWYVRFHFNGNCCDALPDSPHGHAAFYVTVP